LDRDEVCVGSLVRDSVAVAESVAVELRDGSFVRLTLGDKEFDFEASKEFDVDGVAESVLVSVDVSLEVPDADDEEVTVRVAVLVTVTVTVIAPDSLLVGEGVMLGVTLLDTLAVLEGDTLDERDSVDVSEPVFEAERDGETDRVPVDDIEGETELEKLAVAEMLPDDVTVIVTVTV
jgi:hypothetical protein